MAKIMLVEDDNNLREIYEARLLAEGYEIVSAKDGEEALALAVKEKPDLIISDVMMPKISGFDMLDILRSTPETKNTKVIMMTALSQTEDKGRADRLGADRYLVKSQVTLEDVAKVAQDVLNGGAAPEAVAATTAPMGAPEPTAVPDATNSPPVIATPAVEPPTAAPSPISPASTSIPITAEPDVSPTEEPISPPAPTQPPTEPTTPVVDEPAAGSVTPPVEEPEATATAEQYEPAPEETTPAPTVTPITVLQSEEAETPTEAAPASQVVVPTTSEEPILSPSPQVIKSVISDDLTQTTQDQEAEAESQINEILAQAVEPESDEPLAPPPATDLPAKEAAAEETDAIEVAPEPVEELSEPTPTVTPTPIPVEAPLEPPAAPAIDNSSNGQLQDNSGSAVTGAKKVIQPINDMSTKPNLEELLKQEEARSAEPTAAAADQVVAPNPDAPNQQQSNPPSGGIVSPNDIAL
jgi:CheY-like chemotaxis protein